MLLSSNRGCLPLPGIAGLLCAAGLSLAASSPGHSIFVSQDANVQFGINLADNSQDIYFSLTGKTTNQWTAVGMGQSHMTGALVFMLYENHDGTNVTLSPRISYGDREPEYSPAFKIQPLPGTGIDSGAGRLVFRGKCANCRAWDGGHLDPALAAEPFIYALGPAGELRSDDKAEPLRFHAEYGRFNMSMAQAVGPPHVVADVGLATGSTPGQTWTCQRDVVALVHGVVLLVCFLAVLPLAVALTGRWVRTALALEILAGILVVGGVAVGAYGSTWYNRTRGMAQPHQIVGFVVLGLACCLVVADVVIRCRGRGRYGEAGSGQPALLAGLLTFSVVVILLGCINGFLGFDLAGERTDLKILGGVFAAMMILLIIALAPVRRWRDGFRRRSVDHAK